MAVHDGSCHCGAVQFRIDLELTHFIICDCSICTKKGIVHVAVPDECFELLSGEDQLGLYQFKTNTAKHWFCQRCAIHTFGRPRAAPERYTVNARCLDDFETLSATLETRHFDGKNHPKDREGA